MMAETELTYRSLNDNCSLLYFFTAAFPISVKVSKNKSHSEELKTH